MIRFSYIILAILLSFSSCATLSTGKSSKNKVYSEDLSAYLPDDPIDSIQQTAPKEEMVEIDSTMEITARLDSALEKVNAYNKEKTRYIEGLSIQVYAGNNRSEAKNAQLKVLRYFPESHPRIIFDQPNYKVRVGGFYTQFEAYPMYKSVQSRFPKAILVPKRIRVAHK